MKKLAAILDKLMDRFIDKMMSRFVDELLEQGKVDEEKNIIDIYIPSFDITLKLHQVDGARLLNAGVHPMLHGASDEDMDEEEKEAEAIVYMRNARQLICECSETPKIYPHYHKIRGNELSISKFPDIMILEILGRICPFDDSGFLRSNRASVDFMASDCLEEHYVRADNQDEIAHSYNVISRVSGVPLNEILKMSNADLAHLGEIVNASISEDRRKNPESKGE